MSLHMETRLYIDGQFTESSDQKTFPVTSPFTGQTVASVFEATEQDVKTAVTAAKTAFPEWSALSPMDRGHYLERLANLIELNHSEFAHLEALSMGRPIAGYFDSEEAAKTFRHFAQAGYSIMGTCSINTPGFVNMNMRQPLGVVAAIIPWNVPILFLSKKLAPALITGNTVILKSSEKAPLTSLKMANLMHQAGFPPGVVNILSGHGPVGACLSTSMDVSAITFTGSSRTGRTIQVAAANSNLKKVILELGGKSPAIIFPDANVDDAVEATRHSIQWNTGQTCMANTRIYVHENIAEAFIQKFKYAFSRPRHGDPLDPLVSVGPVADRTQYGIVNRYIEVGRLSGQVLLGGEVVESSTSLMIPPTIFTNTPEDAQVMKEEVFGPIVNINTFQTEAEVISKANDSIYGLYGSVFTKDISRALRVVQQLECGTLAVNCTSPTGAVDMPFGGYKLSGQGREGIIESLNNFLEHKSVLIKF